MLTILFDKQLFTECYRSLVRPITRLIKNRRKKKIDSLNATLLDGENANIQEYKPQSTIDSKDPNTSYYPPTSFVSGYSSFVSN